MYSPVKKAAIEANAAIDNQVVDMRRLLSFMREADASGALNALRRTFPAIVGGPTAPSAPDRRRS
jgi:hypothetical protein